MKHVFLISQLFFFLTVSAQTKITLKKSASQPAGKKASLSGAGPKGVSVIKVRAGTPNSFTLTGTRRTSAGVYKNDGTHDILVRTLWSGEQRAAGTYTPLWDGKDDAGNTLASGAYKIKVVSNNLTDTWNVIGNTSPQTGVTRWNGHNGLSGMVFVGTKGYASSYYQEGQSPRFKFDVNNIQVREPNILNTRGYQRSIALATDSKYIYWAEQSAGDAGRGIPSYFWVHATNVSNDLEHIFPGGEAFKPIVNRQYASVIDKSTSKITDVAVNANFIFTAHPITNHVKVLNKNGVLVQTLTYTNPRKLCTDGANRLWIATETNTVKRYIINGDGTLTSEEFTALPGLADPLAIKINTAGDRIAVVDGGTSQQVKFFDNKTSTLSFTLGQAGGYATNSVVYNDKFMFKTEYAFIAFQPDGSYWVGDYYNQRNQHFSSSNVFINNIAFLEFNRVAGAVQNEPDRIYGKMLEWRRDITKSLSPTNGSWVLTNNWYGGLPESYRSNDSLELFEYYYLLSATKFSNNRTYAFVFHQPSGLLELIELVKNGTVRLTGIRYGTGHQIARDGSLYYIEPYHVKKNVLGNSYKKRTLIGFDAWNDPIYAAPVEIDRIEGDHLQEPIYSGGSLTEVFPTASGIHIGYSDETLNTGTHLGGFKNNKWLWKTARSTTKSYTGPFPPAGDFDIGNGVARSHAGGPVRISNRLIFQGYHGEFWKQSQTNIYNVFYDNGLFLAQFGTVAGGGGGAPKMAGNSLYFTVNQIGNDLYLHHPDESYHGGIHEFKIMGANTIQEYVISITK